MVFETPPVFHCFFANVNARSPLTGIIQVFGHVGRDLLRNHQRPATYCALCSTTVEGSEKSRMRTTYQKTSMRFRFFRACAFLAKNPKSYGFFWQCKRCNKKKQVFYILVFANVNGPIAKFVDSLIYHSISILVVLDRFHMRTKYAIWMLIRIAQFEFKRRYFRPCVSKFTSQCVI